MSSDFILSNNRVISVCITPPVTMWRTQSCDDIAIASGLLTAEILILANRYFHCLFGEYVAH
jgi:hypothetical protein